MKPPHAGPRWENWCVEPTILEMNDGRLWMLARTSQDQHHECFFDDGGETWSAWRPSRFHGTLTMSTLFRLFDGRILLFWCNTTPLPEVDRTNEALAESAKNGRWEDVFTNRDACHVAISEDEGRTWIGFREMRLNPLRNANDFTSCAEGDLSVHQPQAIELPGSKVLVAHGQDEQVRALVLFDPAWLYETLRESRFENGLDDWSTHKYIKGIRGHCAYDRVSGGRLIPHPDKRESDARVLQLRHPIDPELVFDCDGATWNFPAGCAGSVTMRLKLLPGGGGAQICLLDRWCNPTDPVVADYATYALTISCDGRIDEHVAVTPGEWFELQLVWKDATDGTCDVLLNGRRTGLSLSLDNATVNGVSYVHLQALPDEEDEQGFLIGQGKCRTVMAVVCRYFFDFLPASCASVTPS